MDTIFCCRFNSRKYPAGRGRLANSVIRETRSCCCNGEVEDDVDDWKEGWLSKFYYSYFDLALDIWSAFAVVLKYICTSETLLALCNSIISVLLYDRYGGSLASDMSWTLVSFAVVFPLTMSITQAFVRRDEALRSLASIRGLLCNIASAHARWDWVGGTKHYNGRVCPTALPLEGEENQIRDTHGAEAQALIIKLIDAIRSYLLVPRKGRARHVYTSCGRKEAKWVEWAEVVGAEHVTVIMQRLHGATETLKSKGLPPNEASRINQYLYFLSREWEAVRMLKEYRTPQAMRSFSRVSVHTLPFFYGPYFLHLSRGDSLEEGNIGFACVFSGLITVFMCSLLLVQTSLENPFSTKSLDTVKVDAEMSRTRRLIEAIMNDVKNDWRDDPPKLSAACPDDLVLSYPSTSHMKNTPDDL